MDFQHISEDALVLSAATNTLLGSSTLATIRLTAVEGKRANAFVREQDRRDFIAAHILVRCAAGLVAERHPDDITIVQRCFECGGPHGKPSVAELPDLHVSWSHTRGAVAAAAAWTPVGVDVERWERGRFNADLAAGVLSPTEQSLLQLLSDHQSSHATGDLRQTDEVFLRIWACKEALVKLGDLTLDTLASCDLSELLVAGDEGGYDLRMHDLSGRWLLEWMDRNLKISGAALSNCPPRLFHIGENQVSALAKGYFNCVPYLLYKSVLGADTTYVTHQTELCTNFETTNDS
jgi:4'-phosphopantetheinyl transferase